MILSREELSTYSILPNIVFKKHIRKQISRCLENKTGIQKSHGTQLFLIIKLGLEKYIT